MNNSAANFTSTDCPAAAEANPPSASAAPPEMDHNVGNETGGFYYGDSTEVPALPPLAASYVLLPDARSNFAHPEIGPEWTVEDDNEYGSKSNEQSEIPYTNAAGAATWNGGSSNTSCDDSIQGEIRQPPVHKEWLVETLMDLKNTSPGSGTQNNSNEVPGATHERKGGDIAADSFDYSKKPSPIADGNGPGQKMQPARGEDAWNKRFAELHEFKAEHGHCNVPQKYEKNASLGAWVARNRLFMRRFEEQPDTCSAIQIQRVLMLKEVGLVSGIGMLRLLARYHQSAISMC
jgi:hypothetical protein